MTEYDVNVTPTQHPKNPPTEPVHQERETHVNVDQPDNTRVTVEHGTPQHPPKQ